MRKKELPKSITNKASSNQVRIAESRQDDGKPLWRFSSVDKDGPFQWPKGKNEELEIVAKLHDFDSMTWKDIEGAKHHYLTESSLSNMAKKRLEKIKLDDEIEHLFSFHLQGKPRIIAIRHNNVARLLWYDPEHIVCPSNKKNT